MRACLLDNAEVKGPRSIPSFWTDNGKALDLLVEKRGEDVTGWLFPLLEGGRGSLPGVLIEDFPYIGLCRALLRHQPDDGAHLWLALLELYDQGIVRMEGFESLPFAAPDGQVTDGVRERALDRANTDLDLSKIAQAAIEHERQAWMLRCIERDLAGASAGQIARGLTLAGLLDATPEAPEQGLGLVSPGLASRVAVIQFVKNRYHLRISSASSAVSMPR